MSDETIYRRTAAGEHEIKARSAGVSKELRYVLIMVDGQASVADLLAKAPPAWEPKKKLFELVEKGYIEDSEGAQPEATGGDVLTRMCDAAEFVLGKKAGKVVEQFQAAGSNPIALVSALDKAVRLVHLTVGEKQAEELKSTCQGILKI